MNAKASSYLQIIRGPITGVINAAFILLLSTGVHAQDLFVSVDESDTGPYSWAVVKISPEGAQSVFASGLRPVYWMAANSAGGLFGANADGNIVEITPTGVQTFVAGMSGPLACDNAGDLFVAANGNIYKYTPDGVQSTFAYGVCGPLAFDNGGNLFVAASDNIYKYTPDGVQSTVVTGLGLTYPIVGLAVDSMDNLFVSEEAMGSYVYKYTPTGTKTTFGSRLGGPCGLACDNENHLFVADNLGLKIAEFQPDGSLCTNIPINGGVWYPTALACQPVPEPPVLEFLTACVLAFVARRRTFASWIGLARET